MSNWITDNKPAAMVAGVGLLLFLGLSVTGYIVNSKRSELDRENQRRLQGDQIRQRR